MRPDLKGDNYSRHLSGVLNLKDFDKHLYYVTTPQHNKKLRRSESKKVLRLHTSRIKLLTHCANRLGSRFVALMQIVRPSGRNEITSRNIGQDPDARP
jgi:hypothetical protein